MRRVAVALLIAATVVACGRENLNPVTPPQKDMPTKRVPAAVSTQSRLELTEYEIRMPDTLAAGHHSFLVVNSGKDNHSLVVEGPGVRTALPQQLTRGNSAQLDVDLKPGTYTFYCPVDEHKGKGMSRTVTVQ